MKWRSLSVITVSYSSQNTFLMIFQLPWGRDLAWNVGCHMWLHFSHHHIIFKCMLCVCATTVIKPSTFAFKLFLYIYIYIFLGFLLIKTLLFCYYTAHCIYCCNVISWDSVWIAHGLNCSLSDESPLLFGPSTTQAASRCGLSSLSHST